MTEQSSDTGSNHLHPAQDPVKNCLALRLSLELAEAPFSVHPGLTAPTVQSCSILFCFPGCDSPVFYPPEFISASASRRAQPVISSILRGSLRKGQYHGAQ